MCLEYVWSEENVSDVFTRQPRGLEASLSQHTFMVLWRKWGPFEWDLIATSANVMKDFWTKANFFSEIFRYFFKRNRCFFSQNLQRLQQVYCFPPLLVIGMILKYPEQQKVDCVMVLPANQCPLGKPSLILH